MTSYEERREQVAREAKEELLSTNETHFPWVNCWALAALAIRILYLFSPHPELLLWSNMCIVSPLLGHMIRAATLIKRNWPLHVQMRGLTELTPDSVSRNLLGWGNAQGLLLTVMLLLANHASAGGFGQLSWMMLCSEMLFIVGLAGYILAESHKTTFK